MSDKNSGSVAITLSKAISVSGASVKALTMREPTVADQLAATKAGTDSAEQELAMIANLCGLAPTDLHQLTLKDYKRVQGAFLGFLD